MELYGDEKIFDLELEDGTMTKALGFWGVESVFSNFHPCNIEFNFRDKDREVELFESYVSREKFATVRGKDPNGLCDLCLGKTQTVCLNAFHDSYCIVCLTKISNQTSLANVVCKNCSKEENLCVKCGEKL